MFIARETGRALDIHALPDEIGVSVMITQDDNYVSLPGLEVVYI